MFAGAFDFETTDIVLDHAGLSSKSPTEYTLSGIKYTYNEADLPWRPWPYMDVEFYVSTDPVLDSADHKIPKILTTCEREQLTNRTYLWEMIGDYVFI